MKTLVTLLTLGYTVLALAADPLYAVIVRYQDGRMFQATRAMPQADCIERGKDTEETNIPDAQHLMSITCELADTVVTKHVKSANGVTSSPFARTTMTICQGYLVAELKSAGATFYTCDPVK